MKRSSRLVNRTPLRSKSRLSRKSPLKRNGGPKPRPPRRLSSPGHAEGRAYLDWVKTIPCCARFISPCSGPTDPHHAGRRPGTGMKAPDATAIPLCRSHHRAVETLAGLPFRLWTKAFRRAWAEEQVEATQVAARAAGKLRWNEKDPAFRYPPPACTGSDTCPACPLFTCGDCGKGVPWCVGDSEDGGRCPECNEKRERTAA